MDIDKASVEWCLRHITPLHAGFTFYHADCRNASYNPHAPGNAGTYRFPHLDSSFELILLTSVLTHLMEHELRHYLNEVARLLTPGGVAYASLFLYGSVEGLSAESHRHAATFPCFHGHYAVNREDHPANAIAYQEEFVREVARQAGLSVIEPTHYGIQDVLLFTKRMDPAVPEALGEGWFEEENECWRWTKRIFVVYVKRPRGASVLRFRFRLPSAVVQEIGIIRLKAFIDGVILPECEYSSAGEHMYVQQLPEAAQEDIVAVKFELNQTYGPKPGDPRELGVQVAFWSRCGTTLRELCPIYLACGSAKT